MHRLEGDDARCIRNRAIPAEHPEAEAIARNAVRGKGGGGQMLTKRNALNQKRALADMRNFAAAPANARKARGLEPMVPLTAPLLGQAKSSRATTPSAASTAAPADSATVPVDTRAVYRSTHSRSLDDHPDWGVPYDAGTDGRARASLVTFDDLKELLESENNRLTPQDAMTGIEWLDKRGGELRPYVSGATEDFPAEIRDYLETPNFHSGFRPVKRKVEVAQLAPTPPPPEVVSPEVYSDQGEKVVRPAKRAPVRRHLEVADSRSRIPPSAVVRSSVYSHQGEIVVRPTKTLPEGVPAVYSSKKILFEGTRDLSGKTVEFAPGNFLQDINHVREILQKNPAVHVEISAFVGPTWWAVHMGTELEGRSPAVYRYYGALMDARANKVRDMLILQGIDPARISTKRGESGIGAEFRKVDFRFFVP